MSMSKWDGVKNSEVETLQFAFGIYESDKNKLDSTQLPRVIYALMCNPSQERFTQVGVAAKPGEKFFNIDEVCEIYSKLKKEIKDMGCYEDFIELMKLYDKNENGWMQLGEVHHMLVALGEKLTEAEIDEVFEDHMGEENDDGEIEYSPFLAGMCEVKK